MLLFHFRSILLAAIILLLIRLSWTDLQQRIISNRIIVALVCVIIPFSWLTHSTFYFLPALLCLIIGFLLFLCKVIGAGDVKLLSVLMLAVPTEYAPYFLFLTALSGLILIIIGSLFFFRSIREKGLPYGIAISSGFLATVVLFSL
ncbi:A24 family peptidase [Mannheimia granulomatis]|uniref:A24 family peptidase n=1 Tax=Mannheimia granulomatis TaxID=85402 RepID=UPI00067AC15D|nr:prepilin peptidase [Mannheimia granulomatis]QLB18802.1 flp operon protein B [Mannheimia granulomatis]